MTESHFKTCFISAPLSVNTTPLRLALEERRIGWSDTVSAKPKGSILETIESAIATEAGEVKRGVQKGAERQPLFAGARG